MTSIILDNCEVKITAKPDVENPRVVTRITLKATHLEHGAIANLSAYKIRRDYCRGQFLEVMDEYSDELHQFSFELFDKNGHVRPWLIDGSRRSGTGCWNRDINEGCLIYLMDMSVKDQFRHQGVGSLVLRKLAESKHVRKTDTIICWPSPVGSVRCDKELRNSLLKKQVEFFRKNHFRRIGRTSFFGYSSNPTHPSRNVPAESDAEAQFFVHPENNNEISLTDASAQYPLHFAIVNEKTEQISAIIRTHYNADPASIRRPDHGGYTPVFVALGAVNMHAIRLLLELGVREDLDNFNNTDGITPLEKLQDTMRNTREFSEALLSTWDGHSTDALKAEYLVKRAMGLPTMADNETKYAEKRKWGCTCGTCAGGWLSPRMRFRLMVEAGMKEDMMDQFMSTFQRGEPHENPADLFDNASEYLPPHLHPVLFKTFYKGYQTIFQGIHDYLSKTNLPLIVEALPGFLSDKYGVQFYLSKGGKYEHALDAVIAVAKEQSPLGDSTFEETWLDEDVVGRDFTGLVQCENDLEFDLVRKMAGLDPRLSWGPYEPIQQEDIGIPVIFGDAEDDMDDDEDEDEDQYMDMCGDTDPEITEHFKTRNPFIAAL